MHVELDVAITQSPNPFRNGLNNHKRIAPFYHRYTTKKQVHVHASALVGKITNNLALRLCIVFTLSRKICGLEVS